MVNLLHKLFGWHYITFPFGYEYVIRRVKKFPNGLRYVRCWDDIYLLDPEKEGEFLNGICRYRPLTW